MGKYIQCSFSGNLLKFDKIPFVQHNSAPSPQPRLKKYSNVFENVINKVLSKTDSFYSCFELMMFGRLG